MGTESSKDVREQGNASDYTHKSTFDALREKRDGYRAKRDAEQTRKGFQSDPDKVARVEYWQAGSTMEQKEYKQQEYEINYDQPGGSTPPDKRQEMVDLDAPERPKLQKFEKEKLKILERIKREIGALKSAYFSDMKEIAQKNYYPEGRGNVLTNRYNTFKGDAEQVLTKYSVTMNKEASKVGLRFDQVQAYVSADPNVGGIHEIPGPPRFDDYGRMYLE